MQGKIVKNAFISALTLVLCAWLFGVTTTHAQVNDAVAPQISFTFDDAFASTYTNALPILAAKDMPGTLYLSTGLVAKDANSITWEQVQELQDTYNWEIGAHTVNHLELPLLTDTEIHNEMYNALVDLQAHDINVTSFATPFGAYDNRVLIESAKYFDSHRGFWDRDDLDSWPYTKIVLMAQSVESATTVAQVKAWVDQAIAQKKWLILVFHEVKPALDPNYEYVTKTADFQQIVDYVASKNLNVVKPESTAVAPGPDFLSGGDFESGLGTNWTTDNATKVTADALGNGRYPEFTHSIKFTGGVATASHLYANKVDINPNEKYLLSAYVNANALTSANSSVTFLIDQYDSNGALLNTVTAGSVAKGVVTDFTYLYQPTAVNVAQVRVQAVLSANAVGTAYLDEFHMYGSPDEVPTPTPTSTPTPTPTTTPTPTPTTAPSSFQINLVQNDGYNLRVTSPVAPDDGSGIKQINYNLECPSIGFSAARFDLSADGGWMAYWPATNITSGTVCRILAGAYTNAGNQIASNVINNILIARAEPVFLTPINGRGYNNKVEARVDAPGAARVELYLTPQGQGYRGIADVNEADGGWTVSWDVSDLAEGQRMMLDAWVVYKDGTRAHTNVITDLVIDRSAPTGGSISVAGTHLSGLMTASASANDTYGVEKVQFLLQYGPGQQWIPSIDTDGSNGWQGSWYLGGVAPTCNALVIAYIYDWAGNYIQTGGISGLCINQ